MAYITPDKIVPDNVLNINGVTMNEYLITNHNINNLAIPSKIKGNIKWVVIHNTEDLANVEDDGRNYIAASVNGNMGGVFATMYVDELCAWQLLPFDRQNWCSSDLVNPDGCNARGISIEIVMDGTSGYNNIKARDNGARLAAYYLHKYGLTVDNLVTHSWAINTVKGRKGDKDYLCTYTTGIKCCPYYIIPTWEKFVAQVQTYLDALEKPVIYRVRKSADNEESQIGAYANLATAKNIADYNRGYKVFDYDGKKVYQPTQYYGKYKTNTDNVPVKFEPEYKAKTVTKFPNGREVTVFLGSETTAENGTVWVKFTSAECKAFSKESAWIPVKYLTKE